jgi:GGDEF domain-containing protein/HAMP domain-containing protein
MFENQPEVAAHKEKEVFRVTWGPQRFYLSIGWKTLIAFALVVFLPMLGLLALTSGTLRQAMEAEKLNALQANLRGAWRVYYERGDNMRAALMQAAASPNIKQALRAREPTELTELLNRQAALLPYADVWLAVDNEQHIIARRHGVVGDRIVLNNAINRAFTLDKPVITTELLGNLLFLQENPLEYAKLETQVLAQVVVVPVRDASNQVGGLVGIVLLNDDNWLPNAIHEYLSIDAALFASVIQESRIISASARPNNIWATGLLAPAELNNAIRQGDAFRGQITINDTPSFVISEPIKNLEDIPVGALSIGIKSSNIDAVIADNTRNIYLFIGVGIFLSLVIAYLAYRDTMTPMRALMGAMDAFALGNLRVRTELRTKDEFEEMGQGFNRMANSIQEHQERVESFNSLASLLISSRRPDELLQKALNKVVDLTGAHAGLIYLAQEKEGEEMLVPFVACGLDMRRMEPLLLGQGLPGEAAQQKRPIHATTLPEECRIIVHFGIAQALPTEVAFFPLIYRDEVLGVMLLASLNHFRAADMATLEYTSNQIAIVLENALTHEKVERLSITDELTQLFNRRHLSEQLNREMSKADRYGTTLSLLMLDIDHFKHINDEHGHQSGDEALRTVAKIIRSNLREADIAGRYGGEEFVIILPHTRNDEAFAVCMEDI